MKINLKNFLSDKSKLSNMGEFQDLKPLDGLEVSSISADLYDNGRDDLALFYFKEGANYATLNTTNSIVSETISWNEKSNKKVIKALLVNTKNSHTLEELLRKIQSWPGVIRTETQIILSSYKNGIKIPIKQ